VAVGADVSFEKEVEVLIAPYYKATLESIDFDGTMVWDLDMAI
jgi:hypothetical protein